MKRFKSWFVRVTSVMMMMVAVALMLMACALQTGCASARVVNEASYKVTAADGTVTERHAVNRIFALGDKAVEQNLKGSLADATEADLSAGIQESTQKSESGVIAEGMFALGGKAMDTLGKYFDARIPGGGGVAPATNAGAVAKTAPTAPATPTAPTAPTASAAVTGASEALTDSTAADPAASAAADTAVEAADCKDGSCSTPAATAKNPAMAGSPGANGVGVYGRAACSLCQVYKTSHPDVAMIDLDNSANCTALWDALRARGYTGKTAGLPVVITETGYEVSAK